MGQVGSGRSGEWGVGSGKWEGVGSGRRGEWVPTLFFGQIGGVTSICTRWSGEWVGVGSGRVGRSGEWVPTSHSIQIGKLRLHEKNRFKKM